MKPRFFSILVLSLLLTNCAPVPTTISTTATVLVDSTTATIVPTETRIPTPTEIVEPFLSEKVAHKLTIEGTIEGVPLAFTINTYESMVPGENQRIGKLIEKEIIYNGRFTSSGYDIFTVDPEATVAKDNMIDGLAWKKYQWWQTNVTEEQNQLVADLFGKELSQVAHDEYWNMVHLFKTKQQHNSKSVTLDEVGIPIYGYNVDTNQVQWTVIDPTKPVELGFTDHTAHMTLYKNGNDSNASPAYGAVIRNGILEIRIKLPESIDMQFGLSLNWEMIIAMNRLSFPVSEQSVKEIPLSKKVDLDNYLKPFDPEFWDILMEEVEGRGNIGPLMFIP